MVVIRHLEGLMAEVTVAWGNKVSAEFKERVIQMAATLGTKPDYLMAIMAFETGGTFDPAQKNLANPTGGPVGLIQFTEVAANALGTTKGELVKLTAVKQLDYVEKHLMRKKDLGLSKVQDLYAAVHWPAATGKPLSHVLYSKTGSKQSQMFYRKNAGLDLDKNGQVTLEEAAKKVEQALKEGEQYRG